MSVSDAFYAGAVALSFVGLTADSLFKLTPVVRTDDIFVVHRLDAVREGETAVFDYDRTIVSPIVMAYSVRVFSETPTGWALFCPAESSPFRYAPDRALPPRIDLGWWTDGDCPVLPPQRALIETTWTPQVDGLDPISIEIVVE